MGPPQTRGLVLSGTAGSVLFRFEAMGRQLPRKCGQTNNTPPCRWTMVAHPCWPTKQATLISATMALIDFWVFTRSTKQA